MQKKIYFISDLHLGASYLKDEREAELRIVRFLDSITDKAEALYMMGDVLDYWFEYRTVVPRGYVRFFGALARLADARVKIYWFIGNHDIWLFDYLRDEIGITIIDGVEVKEIYGKRFFLSHGDGVGKLKPSFRLLRWFFRNKVCQRMYAAIHPRWTIPFAHGWSNHSRNIEAYKPEFAGLEDDPLARFAEDYYRNVDSSIDYFVFGHEHVVVDEPLSPTCRLIILGDWINHFTYAEFDGENLEIKSYISAHRTKG